MLQASDIRYLVVHCSDTDDDLTASDIHTMHQGFGWDGIGYHAGLSGRYIEQVARISGQAHMSMDIIRKALASV